MDIATIEMYESTLSPEDMDMRRRSQSIIMEPLDYKVNYRCLPLVTGLPGCIGLSVKTVTNGNSHFSSRHHYTLKERSLPFAT